MKKMTKYIKKYQTRFVAAFFALLALTAFFPTIFQNKTPLPTDVAYQYLLNQPKEGKNVWIRDSLVQMYPNFHVAFTKWKKGEAPLENEFIFAGNNKAISTLGSGQSQAFHPTMLLANFYTSSLTLYSHIIVLLFFIAGFSMYLFMHNQTKKPLVAILTGIGFMFSGPLVAWLSWGTIPGIISTTPLLLFFIDKYFTKNELKWLVPATLTHYWMASSGHLQFYFFALCLAAAYTVFKYFSTKKKKRPKILPLLITALIQISIALIFIIPFFQSIQSAHRSHITDINTLQSKNLAQLFAPDVWGSHTAFTGPLNYVETFSYPGIILLALAAVSLLIFFINKTFHTKEEKFWFFILGTVLAYTLFPQPTEWIGSIIPFFKSFPPFRAVFILTTTIIVLAGLFAKRIHIKNAKLTSLYFVCAILLTLVQGWQLFTQYTPQQSKEPLQNPPPHITFLQNQDTPLIYSELHPLNMYALYGISSLFGYDTTYSEAYYQDISQNADSTTSHRNILNAEISNQTYLQELGVTYIVTNKESPHFNNLPIAYEDANVRIFQLKK